MSTTVASGVIDAPTPAATATVDATGRDRMVWNVLTTWGGHLVFIVAGFLMPRLIDSHLGQVSLGVWDFGWSIVSYFVLAQVGVGSSVNRYVAKFRSMHDVEALCRTVSSVNVIQMASFVFAVSVAAGLAWVLPVLFGDRLGLEVTTARWTILLLGSSVAVQLAFNAFGGVLTGCHRWDVHNAITAGAYAVIVVGMITVLTLGGGLPALAAVYLAGTLAGEIVRVKMAYRLCPELRIHPSLATWPDIRMLLAFGGKTVVDNMARLLLAQANSILVATHLGPAALAVYARPGALVRHVDTFTNKFGMVLSPTASSLKSTAQLDDLRTMFTRGTRFAAFVAMPIVVFLSVMGDPILQVWMGPRYREGLLMTVTAIGNFLPMTQRPAGHVLIGLNRHGRVGWASLVVACIGVGAAAVALGPMQGGMIAAALTLVIPYSLGNGLFVMVYACRSVGVPLLRHLREAFLAPLAWAVPLAAALFAVRYVFAGRPVLELAVGAVVTAALVLPVYWFAVLPPALRGRISAQVARRLRGGGRSPAITVAVAAAERPSVEVVKLRPVPYPYASGLAICSDLDETPDASVYLESARYLNTTEQTSMGPGVGLEVGNTIYFDMPPGQFAYWNTDDAGRDMVRALIRSGHIDCLHSFGDLATTRADAVRSLTDLARHGCRLEVWIDHAVAPTNLGADIMKGSGDVPASPAYHADLTCAAGVRFVWRGRVTSAIGQNAPWSVRGIGRFSEPLRSMHTIAKESAKRVLAARGDEKYAMHAGNALLREIRLRDGQPVYEFLRSNPHVGGVSCGDTASGIGDVLSDGTLQELVRRRALTIVYTHLGKIRSPQEPFDAAARDGFRRLARLQAERRILVTTTRRLLGFAAALKRVAGTAVHHADGSTHVNLDIRPDPRPMDARDLEGLTVYVQEPARTRLFVDGREISRLQRNAADETGTPSVTIPWTRLEFPRICL